MRIDCFLDTNVLIYAATGRRDEPRKFAIADDIVTTRKFGASAQTVSEFYNVATRGVLAPLSPEEVDEWIDVLLGLPFTQLDARLVLSGVTLARQHRIRIFDATLLAAAERLGAPVFYSEDLNHGQLYGSVRVINPFREIVQ
jgi:predicted nucleic acid-binding protein